MASLYHQKPSHNQVFFSKYDCQMWMASGHGPMLSGLSTFPTSKRGEDCDKDSKDSTQKGTFKRYVIQTWAAPIGYISLHSNLTLSVHPSWRLVTIGQSSGFCVKSWCPLYYLVSTGYVPLEQLDHLSFPCHLFAILCCWLGSPGTVASLPS